MINIWKKLPMDLVNKIMSYQPIESPAMLAFISADIREIKDNELWCKVEGDIKLLPDDDMEDELNTEWFHFLIAEHYGVETN